MEETLQTHLRGRLTGTRRLIALRCLERSKAGHFACDLATMGVLAECVTVAEIEANALRELMEGTEAHYSEQAVHA